MDISPNNTRHKNQVSSYYSFQDPKWLKTKEALTVDTILPVTMN